MSYRYSTSDDYYHLSDQGFGSLEPETFEEAVKELNEKKLELKEYEIEFKKKWKSDLRKQKIKKLIDNE